MARDERSLSGTPASRSPSSGFIVIEMGNRNGHPLRSTWCHNARYGNLRDLPADK